MKKVLPLFLALLLLTACSRAPAAPAPEERPAPTEAPAVTPEASAPEETQNAEEDDSVQTNTAAENQEPVIMSGETVTLDGIDSYLRLTLPEGWSWEPEVERAGQKSILLCAPTDDDFRVQAIWWESFGMCGTGVDFQEIELPGSRKATLATETIDGLVWWTLVLPPNPDWFTLQLSATQEEIDAHQSEIDAMLETLQIGALSHIPPQPQPPRDSI